MKTIDSVLQIIESDVLGKNVLEVACGSADLSVAMSPLASTVKCIDLVDFRLNAAIFKCKNVKFAVMDATKMEFQNNAFDTVVIYNATYHIKDDFDKILAECLRVCKKGGAIFVISSFSIDKLVTDNTVIPSLQNARVHFCMQNFKNLISVCIRT